jgi:hypothetical protein
MVEHFSVNAVCSVTDGGFFPLPPFVPAISGRLPAPTPLFFGCRERGFAGSACSKNQSAYEYAYHEPRRAFEAAVAPDAACGRARRDFGFAEDRAAPGKAAKPQSRCSAADASQGECAAGQFELNPIP